VGVGIGGSGGGGGNGGRVTAELAAQVVTEGQNSGGVLVQSVGGGGGNGGFSITGALAYGSTNSGALAIGLGGTGGQGGQGGGVDSDFVGKVFTGGADSGGVAAQSLGGGGGNGGLNVSGTI